MASMFPFFEDDGLIIPEVGPWGVQKYRLVENYATMFATSMKGKWGCRVYIKVAEILQQIPQNQKGFKVLCFCFVDPYSLNNLAFETIRKLASRSMDFLILIPSGMDANRNVSYYISPSNTNVDRFLGTPKWREAWKKAELEKRSFGHYVTEFFDKQMKTLGYIYSGIEETVQIRSTEKNLPLYHLAFFSRHKLGEKFWKEAKKYSNDQLGLFS